MRPPKSMLAWRSVSRQLESLIRESQPLPEPLENEALVRVDAAALNFSDILMLEDRYQIRPDRPFTPGQEIAGTVVRAGPACRLQDGDRVASELLRGGFADYAVVRDAMAIKLPESLPIHQAAVLPVVYTTALLALTECTTLSAGETLLVHAAAGGVGLAAVEIGKNLGARVIAAASSPEKRDIALKHGATHAIDYTDPEWPDEIKSLTDGKGANVILDVVGGDITKDSLKCIAWGGRLLIVGFAGGKIHDIPANRLLLKSASAIGVYYKHDMDPDLIPRISGRLLEMIEDGSINPLVNTQFSMADLPAAIDALRQRRSVGKIVLLNNAQGEHCDG